MSEYKSAFLSYSDDATTKAKQIAGYLEPLGIDIFDFQKDLDQKRPPKRGVRNAIKARDAVIMILSAKSRDSTWVANELGLTSGLGKPILIYKTAPNLQVPDFLDEYEAKVLEKLEDLEDYFPDQTP